MLLVLLAFMGLRTGVVIGAVLLITVAGTLFIMQISTLNCSASRWGRW